MPHNPNQKPVEAYSAAEDNVAAELDYPGKRPNTSFMTDGETVTALSSEYTTFVKQADAMLEAQGLPLIEDRFPVLSYGANASPVRLAGKKMNQFGAQEQTLMQNVPHIVATVPDTLAIWHGRPGQNGSVFAELYKGEHAKGAQLHTHVAFLTAEQLGAIHATEGTTYSMVELPVWLGSGKQAPETTVAAYVALDSQIATTRDGSPILVAGLKNQGAKLPRKTARLMVGSMLREADVKRSVEDYVADGLSMKLAEKKARQADVGAKLAERGYSQKFAFTDMLSPDLIGRADFASLPGSKNKHLHQLPEMVLAKIRPSEEEMATKVDTLQKRYPTETEAQLRVRAAKLIDPARRVSSRAHDELQVRLQQAESEEP